MALWWSEMSASSFPSLSPDYIHRSTASAYQVLPKLDKDAAILLQNLERPDRAPFVALAQQLLLLFGIF